MHHVQISPRMQPYAGPGQAPLLFFLGVFSRSLSSRDHDRGIWTSCGLLTGPTAGMEPETKCSVGLETGLWISVSVEESGGATLMGGLARPYRCLAWGFRHIGRSGQSRGDQERRDREEGNETLATPNNLETGFHLSLPISVQPARAPAGQVGAALAWTGHPILTTSGLWTWTEQICDAATHATCSDLQNQEPWTGRPLGAFVWRSRATVRLVCRSRMRNRPGPY
ncbi:hypothetical protein B0T22DRAFT_74278 [Podospora appendiculata]|uniref:Uncharacterized protein n=1 Tax=Podospora appendiculata TaxID=314037 RepID=A0AAE1CHI9_9PEZI|nr:hypothetical protein B0T22DRAFT_74278 [Podospora appendiculata]